MPAKSRSEKTPWLRRWALKCAVLLALVALFMSGLLWAGRWGLEQLRGRERYDVPFADIECDPPVGMDRRKFLDEVRYAAPELPERLDVLDKGLQKKLREGFAKHRWVESVDKVEIKPPKHIVVTLTHRTPVLAVKVGDTLRAVDRHGFLLHTDAPTRGLPIYDGAAPPPQGEGKRWGDPNVEAEALKQRQMSIKP